MVKYMDYISVVYVMLFIPAFIVFYHTIYRHDTSGTVDLIDVPFIVLRMGFVDYDYGFGVGIAREQGLELWWNILVSCWICISALIVVNLFIALMADRSIS